MRTHATGPSSPATFVLMLWPGVLVRLEFRERQAQPLREGAHFHDTVQIGHVLHEVDADHHLAGAVPNVVPKRLEAPQLFGGNA